MSGNAGVAGVLCADLNHLIEYAALLTIRRTVLR